MVLMFFAIVAMNLRLIIENFMKVGDFQRSA